jgi:hypothetical protein
MMIKDSLLNKLNEKFFKIDLRADEEILNEFRVNMLYEKQIHELQKLLIKFKKEKNEEKIYKTYEYLAKRNDYIIEKLLNAKRKIISPLTSEMNKELYIKIALECEDLLMNPSCGMYCGLGADIKNPKNDITAIYALWNNLNNHSATTGTTRVGKTYKMLSDIKQIGRRRENLIVFDPKEGEEEEILKMMWDTAINEERQEDWRHISPERVDDVFMFYNFIYGLNNQEISSLMSDLVGSEFYKEVAYDSTLAILESYEFIQTATDPDNSKTEEYLFKEIQKARNLEKYFSEEYDFDTINNVVSPNFIETINSDNLKNVRSKENLYFSRTLITLRDIAYYFNSENLLQLKSTVELINATPETKAMKESALRLLNKIVSTDSGFMSKVTKSTDVIFTQLTTGPIGRILNTLRCNTLRDDFFNPNKSIMLLVQTSSIKYKAISSYLSKIVLKMFENMIGNVSTLDEKLYRKISVLIDEANAVLYPGIEDLFNKAGGIGLKLFLYTQSFADYILKLKKDNANVVLDNINTYNLMRMNEEDSIKKAVEKVGSKQRVMASLQFSDALMFRSGAQVTEVAQIQHADFSTFEVGHSVMVHYGNIYWLQHPAIKLPKIKIIMPESKSMRLRKELENRELQFIKELNELENVA